MNENRNDWGSFYLWFFFTCFLVICNYGTIANIVIWLCYAAGRTGRSDWDIFHFRLIGIFIVINIILTCIFVKFWM